MRSASRRLSGSERGEHQVGKVEQHPHSKQGVVLSKVVAARSLKVEAVHTR